MNGDFFLFAAIFSLSPVAVGAAAAAVADAVDSAMVKEWVQKAWAIHGGGTWDKRREVVNDFPGDGYLLPWCIATHAEGMNKAFIHLFPRRLTGRNVISSSRDYFRYDVGTW